MSRLEELIAVLCPDGVENKRLGEFTNITRGGSFQKKDFADIGVPCIHYGQIYTRYGLFAEQTISFINSAAANKSKFASQNDIIMAVTSENVEDVCKSVAWLGSGEIAVSGHTAIIRHNQNPKYLSYYFHSSMFFIQKVKLAHGTKVIEVTPDKLKNIIIPLPPLPVQREIVRILDNFTELTAELTAELIARKKQYEYYRDELLTFGDDVPMIALGDTCNLKSGKAVSSSLISTQKDERTPIACFGGNGIRGYVKEASHHGEFPIIGRQGALCGNVNYATGSFYATEHAVVVKSLGKYDQRFLYYLLTAMNLNQYKSQGAQPGLAVGNLENIFAPLPSLDEQQRIVNILDRFDTLCNDLTSGLPAEIEARRKQYEYYRDKLLTFKEKMA